MRHVHNFLLGFVLCFIALTISTGASTADVVSGGFFKAGVSSTVPDLTELIKYLLSTLGGVITSIILAFLRKKFPEWFPSSILKVSK